MNRKLAFPSSTPRQNPSRASLPTLTRYDSTHLDRVALPLGGIGTGTVSLGGRGNLQDWEMVNRPAKGFDLVESCNPGAFFALWTKDHLGRITTRVLEGAIPESQYESWNGISVANHNLPRFGKSSFEAAYPFGRVQLSDKAVPLSVRIEAFNPLIPCESEASSLPLVALRYVLVNTTARTISASVCGSIPNLIGVDGAKPGFEQQVQGNANVYRKKGGLHGVLMHSAELPSEHPCWGTMALATTSRGEITHRIAWAGTAWGDDILDFWDDFSADGLLDKRPRGTRRIPHASLAVKLDVPARSERAVEFLLTWHFPNRQSWNTPAAGSAEAETVGNHYTGRFGDAWGVAEHVAPELATLERKTAEFVEVFCSSDLPHEVKEAALFNVSTLRTQTVFQLPSGHLAGWEGCNTNVGSCPGSCNHVWNYETTLPFLFGDLSRSMREVEFQYSTDDTGLMVIRTSLPLGREQEWKHAAADGQMGCLMKLYRDWQLSGDDQFLQKLWPRARKALEFCWLEGGWDADGDGVMEGAQHNTMDVEYFGPNPQMMGWYLGALRATSEMAAHMGEAAFAEKCANLFQSGSIWMDRHLFNGEYYEQKVVPQPDPAKILTGLVVGMGSKNLASPDLQLGPGCLVDQLVGQYMAHVCGLGYLHSTTNVRKTLRAIMKYNYRKSLAGHFNPMRTFAFNDESALLMGSYPRGGRPTKPFPYYNEVMTGFEYTAASGMIFEGMEEPALRCIRSIRSRYDGKKRNPFSEAECGHHYVRGMAAWTTILALTGFHYSAVTGAMRFRLPKTKNVRWFFSTGYGWGRVEIVRRDENSASVKLEVLGGKVQLTSLRLADFGVSTLRRQKLLGSKSSASFLIKRNRAGR